MGSYHYEPWVYEEITRCARGLFPPGLSFKLATKQEDVGGIDTHYIVDHCVPLQLRCRFDSPAWAADHDVTFRATEPAMMAAGTYAPLALFCWLHGHIIKAAKLISVYDMWTDIDPPLPARPIIMNYDETGFHTVAIWELHNCGALLRLYDGNVWATATLGGEMRLNRILNAWKHKGEPSPAGR